MTWRRIVLLSLLLLAALVGMTWALLQHSDAATQLLTKELHQRFRVRAEIESSRVELGAGRLAIKGFELGHPGEPQRTLLRIDRGHVDLSANPFGELLQPRHIVIDGLHVDCGPEWPDINDLLMVNALGGSEQSGPPELPVIEIRSGTATLQLCPDGPPLQLEQLQLKAVPHRESPQQLQLLGRVLMTEPRAEFDIRGQADLGTGAAQISLSTEQVNCSEASMVRLARLIGIDNQGLEVGGEIRSLAVLCRIPPRDAIDRTTLIEAKLVGEGLRVNSPDLPPIISAASVDVHVSSADGGVITAEAHQHTSSGIIDLTTRISGLDGEPDIEVRAAGRDVVVDDKALATLRTFWIGRQVVDALHPTTGRADLDLYLLNPHRRGSTAELELTLREVAMSYHGFGDEDWRIGFPLPLVEAKGRVRLRDGVLLLEDVAANIAPSAGGGSVRLTGRIDTTVGNGEDTSLDIEGEDVAFSRDLRGALSTLLRDNGDLYDRLSPSGRAAVRVHVRPRRELAGGFRVEILPHGAAMRWAGFPYRLDNLNGSIVVRSSGVRFDLAGEHGPGILTMRGRIPLHEQHADEDGFEAVVDLEHLTVDDDLLQAVTALVPELGAPWRDAEPVGSFSGQVKVWRPQPQDPLYHDVRLDLEGVDLRLPLRPWRAVGLSGQVLIQGSDSTARIDFDALRGRLGHTTAEPAQLAVLGHLESGANPRHDLAFVVRDLELCDQLGQSLDELGALDRNTWDTLQPSGKVDLVCRRELRGPDDEDLRVVVQLVDVRSDAPMLPKPAEHMTGELHIEDGELTFRDVRGLMAGVLVQAWDGRVYQRAAPDNRTEATFSVRAHDFPVDDGLANLFCGPLRTAVLERELRGKADVDGLQLEFALPTSDSTLPFSTRIQGQLGLAGVDMLLGTGRDGIRVLDLHGVVNLADSTVTEEGGQLQGTLRSASLSLLGHPFEAIEADFTADAERLLLNTLTTRIHGGLLDNARSGAPALVYLLPSASTPDGRLAADLRFERVDVFSLLHTSGWHNPPYSGSASGKVTLRRLDGNDVIDAEAEGELAIERGNLGTVPLFRAIYAQLPSADRPRFDQLQVNCRLTDRRITFEDLEVRSDILAAKGQGSLDLDGYLDVRMELNNLLGTSADPVVMPLIEFLAKNIVRFHLFGHLRDLHAEQRWLTESSPKRRQVLPMPPAGPPTSGPKY